MVSFQRHFLGGRSKALEALTSGDTLFLAFYLGHGIAPITFRFACPPQTSALDDTSLSARLSLAERALRVSEVERSRLQREVEELRMALTHTDNVLATNLARTTDALERVDGSLESNLLRDLQR